MDVHLLHVVTSRSEILTWIEVRWVLSEMLADSSGHGKTRVGVDVDLADSALGSFAELLLGDTDSIGQLATISIDGVDLFLWN